MFRGTCVPEYPGALTGLHVFGAEGAAAQGDAVDDDFAVVGDFGDLYLHCKEFVSDCFDVVYAGFDLVDEVRDGPLLEQIVELKHAEQLGAHGVVPVSGGGGLMHVRRCRSGTSRSRRLGGP
ncbi:hypothetical protein Areg01_41480 [Actinoplanes regularis]|nr:hypothetical protein Areg01_41480 [Actinoplanes regularis]